MCDIIYSLKLIYNSVITKSLQTYYNLEQLWDTQFSFNRKWTLFTRIPDPQHSNGVIHEQLIKLTCETPKSV